MPRRLIEKSKYAQITRLLLLTWRPQAIAVEVGVAPSTVYKIERNLHTYGSPGAPRIRQMGPPRKITVGDGRLLLQYINEQPWVFQGEMVSFLWEECGIEVDQSTVSRFLKKERWTKKVAQRIASAQNEELRQAWKVDMLTLRAEQLVFVDESLFNQTTGWRKKAWAPIGNRARYHDSVARGRSWSILPAYTVDGYLDCVGIKEGYFNAEEFYTWITESLLPSCQPGSVIIMDNNSTHVKDRIRQAIVEAGHRLLFLPPYSPDYNPIELSFGILKAWMRRHYYRLWPSFDGDFGAFIRYAITISRCDRFAEEHFRFSGGGGYIFEGDIEAFYIQLDSLMAAREEAEQTVGDEAE